MDIHPREIRNITITPEILKRIVEIDDFKGCWKVMESLAPEKLTSLRRIATIESVGSSTCIAGAKLSNREVEKLLSGEKAKSFASRDEQKSRLRRRDGHGFRKFRVSFFTAGWGDRLSLWRYWSYLFVIFAAHRAATQYLYWLTLLTLCAFCALGAWYGIRLWRGEKRLRNS